MSAARNERTLTLSAPIRSPDLAGGGSLLAVWANSVERAGWKVERLEQPQNIPPHGRIGGAIADRWQELINRNDGLVVPTRMAGEVLDWTPGLVDQVGFAADAKRPVFIDVRRNELRLPDLSLTDRPAAEVMAAVHLVSLLQENGGFDFDIIDVALQAGRSEVSHG